jgi:hypothetical protein
MHMTSSQEGRGHSDRAGLQLVVGEPLCETVDLRRPKRALSSAVRAVDS